MGKIVGIAGLGQEKPIVGTQKTLVIVGAVTTNPKYQTDLVEIHQSIVGEGGIEGILDIEFSACSTEMPDEILTRRPTEKEQDLFIDCVREGAGLPRKYTGSSNMLLIGAGVLAAGLGVWWLLKRA